MSHQGGRPEADDVTTSASVSEVHAHRVSGADVRRMLWCSAVAYVLAQLVVILLHETSHAVAGLLLGYRVTELTGEVRYSPEPGTADQVVTALTGPAFSLLSGLLAMSFRPFRRGFAPLLWMWLAFLSAEEGIGYLVIAPLVSAGDTGSALAALDAPGWVGWACFAVGAAGLVLLARRFAVEAVRYTRDLYEIRALCVWAWLVGTAVSVVVDALFLALTSGTSADSVVAILVGSASLGVFAPMAMLFWQRVRVEKTPLALGAPLVAVAVAVLLVAVKALVLTRGVHLG